MNVSDIELFKKSKIIEIGSVKKSYGSAKLEVFGKNSEILRFSYLKSEIWMTKLSPKCKLIPKSIEVQKVYHIKLFSF